LIGTGKDISMSPSFVSPPDALEFFNRVWQIVRLIPRGKVATYGQVASLIQVPDGMSGADYRAFGARWVGGALANCPDDVPWQRIINAQGKISPRRRGGESLQREILEAEGVIFNDRDRVDLSSFGWSGPEKSFETVKEGNT
jgi:methylated-DNA-protein-cysteine methyltransferase-like protein